MYGLELNDMLFAAGDQAASSQNWSSLAGAMSSTGMIVAY